MSQPKSIEEKKALIASMIEGKISVEELFRIITSEKDPEMFDALIAYFQEKVQWKEKILMVLGDHLFIVCKDGKPIVKALCGYEFGDFRVNWKVKSKVFVRDTEEKMREIYPKFMHPDTRYFELREYYCPGCYTLLEVEVVPPGYPPVFTFLPDIVTFYEEWLKRPFPCEKVEFKDLTLEWIKENLKVEKEKS
jgi:acetone carboxylase gamma subunit